MNLMSSLRIGIVVAVHPEGNSIDVQMQDGTRFGNVQVLVPSGSVDTGMIDLPDVGLPEDESRWDLKGSPSRYMRAVIGVASGTPMCVGFLLPQENQISFPQKNRRIIRHASDVYTTIDGAGNTEFYHPSGTYLRIGEDPEHEDLEGADFDKLWKIAANTDKEVNLRLVVANGGTVKATINVDPDGNIAIEHSGNLSVTTAGNATLAIDGNAEVSIGGDATIDVTGSAELTADGVTINSDVTIDGDVEIEGEVHSSGDVVAGSISLQQHTHPGVQTGGGSTGPAQ